MDEEVEIHCPRCGDVMVTREAGLTCLRGEMMLSKYVAQGLKHIVVSNPIKPEPRMTRWGGWWHCPADGSQMTEESGLVRCYECGRFLPGGMIYNLIELHTHTREDASVVVARNDVLNAILTEYCRNPRGSSRKVADAAIDLFGPIESRHRQSLVAEVASSVDEVITYVRAEAGDKGRWDRRRAKAADSWVALRWPWMTKKSRKATIAQGWWVMLW
jgi:uncharacterized Zn finger protein (UPF0148 family)